MKGPAVNLDNVAMYAVLDTSFRIVLSYQGIYDQILARIDVKIGNEQYHVAFVSGMPIEPQDGSKILPKDDLITPKDVLDCLNIKVNRWELIKALKELTSDIENNQ